ncbi:MAG: TonB-dependent receptor domain-containing protein, partial [Gammaproteobacteria bacterium]
NQGYYLTAKTWPSDGPVPEAARRGVADLSWAGLGQVVAYDAQGLMNSDFYRRWDAQNLETGRLGDSYTIKERVTTLFAKADFETQLGSINTFGNVGLQFIGTRQASIGSLNVSGSDFLVKSTKVSDGANYNKVLPSLNANFELSDTQTVRFAASKAISRARIDQLRPGGNVGFSNNVTTVVNPDPASGPWTSTTGNAKLRPNEVNQADLSYEYYFAKDGYVSVGAFYKDIVNWSRTGRQIADFTPYYIPELHKGVDSSGRVFAPATLQGVRTFFEDGLTGSDRGYEIATTVPLRLITSYLDGFGIVANAAFNKGSFDDGSRIPGLSKEAYSLTAYYEKYGFSARVAATKRSSFLSERRGVSNSLTPANRLPLTLVDAQVSYDFAGSSMKQLQGLRISFNAQNLTKQDDSTVDTASGQITQYDRYGARYELSLKYSF